MITWAETRDFLDRPCGGMEVEFIFAFAELWFGWSLIITPHDLGLWNIAALQAFYGRIPADLIGFPWVISGLLTWYGLYLYRAGNRLCAPIRWWAGLLSFVLWGWLAIVTWALVIGSLPTLGLYIAASLVGIRVMFSAYRRWSQR